MVIYFTRYHPDKSIATSNGYNDELIGKIEEDEGKKLLDGWWLMIKRISIKKLEDIRILIDTDDKLTDNVTLKNDMWY